ncbi:putative Glycerophosphoryl diester phosphodiesterase family [Monocercomonoides exilis]|uniref:putative Glycerophosphoryl diester phosphodiesterase family n=1 Tax=Monocercomonoides exilis TaxID=2049356 RepID=UPI00355A480F|nr:putative Glycerophosphoryl diester phosphodiesterase family [Monocercomonoides exilis]|eukprot:MONOS_1661.1-p1 / transcript=MONOS_1661.1 / gene=MONOS_1661 / organism=Monocercomonoides_exilis_PA203 / gene_product=unspecified product / transcript_product=unspecified product / location=Mono_scaffold00030:175150-176670(+) / protein_length=336 / sequence_SO=supercontig / SO=protein_coding / is_pseudo=false
MFGLLLFLLNAAQCFTVIGHRGSGCSQPKCVSLYPENSIPSYLQAIKDGADVVELDVWLSSDDQIVISHRDLQSKIERLGQIITPSLDGSKTPSVKHYNASERYKFRVKLPWAYDKVRSSLYKSDKYVMQWVPPIPLPKLSEVLDAVCPTGKKIVIELKGNDKAIGPRVFDLVTKKKMESCIHVVSSFYWKKYHGLMYQVVTDLMEPIKDDNRLKKALLFSMPPTNYPNMFKSAKYYNASAFHPACSLLSKPKMKSFIAEANGKGYDTMCYFGTNNKDDADTLRETLKTGVKSICTNRPGVLRKIVDEVPLTEEESTPAEDFSFVDDDVEEEFVLE